MENIQIVYLWLECRHEDVFAKAPLVNGIATNNALFRSNSHINQLPPQIVHSLRFFSGRVTATDFVMKMY